jgi:hypothetical protein
MLLLSIREQIHEWRHLTWIKVRLSIELDDAFSPNKENSE